MRNLIAFPVLILAFMLQVAVLSRIPVLSGFADLPIVILAAWSAQEQVRSAWLWALAAALLASFVSGMNPLVYFVGYLLMVGVARFIRRQVWQLPILEMFTVVFFGTLVLHLFSFIGLRLTGTTIALGEMVALITLPSLFLNFLLSIPIYSLLRDLAQWVYPAEELV